MVHAPETAKNSSRNATSSLPQHIAIIMDGNNRWLKQQGGSGLGGHKAGAEAAKGIIRACAERGIACLTLFAFSSENWQRPRREVTGLLNLFVSFLNKTEVREMHVNNIRLSFIGNRSRFSQKLQKLMHDAETLTADNDGLKVIVAADYGGRWDITNAAQKLAMQVQAGTLQPEDITENLVHSYIAASDLPMPDLCIRTGGEHRISNFLLWQLAYTELYFTSIYWPDFDAAELDKAINDFIRRQRRYGKLSEQVELPAAGSEAKC
jgi:undecaprenyl diphosphate synthase